MCLHSKRSKSGSASVGEALAYFLKFQYLTDLYVRIRKSKKKQKHTTTCTNNTLYQNYLENEKKTEASEVVNINNNVTRYRSSEDNYCAYLDNAIFGSPTVMENLNTEHLMVKRNNKGLIPVLLACDEEKKTSGEIIRHNLQKVQFFEQNQTCTTAMENIFVSFNFCSSKDFSFITLKKNMEFSYVISKNSRLSNYYPSTNCKHKTVFFYISLKTEDKILYHLFTSVKKVKSNF